jgi:hypothetical protein
MWQSGRRSREQRPHSVGNHGPGARDGDLVDSEGYGTGRDAHGVV